MREANGAGRRNLAQVRGDIDRGRTGDKVKGFDPAAAPLETDAEAGGQPLVGQAAETAAQPVEAARGGDERSYGTAMRPFEGTETESSSGRWWIAAIVACVAVAAIVFMALG